MNGACEVNGRPYRIPEGRFVVVCIDGSDPRYLDDALARGLMPRLQECLASDATYALGQSQMPSFTNPNNLSIVTGLPPSGHGLSGNHFLTPDGDEVQLTDPRHLWAPTIYAGFHAQGVPVACVATKDKLRRLLASGGVPCVSAELAHEQSLPEFAVDSLVDLVGRPNPAIYDPDCSVYALELGLALGRRLDSCLLYVSLTDYVQHSEAPGGPMADRLYAELDRLWGEYLEHDFRIALVADHGMNAKTTPEGEPNVRFLEDALVVAGILDHRVLLPITDPYVAHHASLGSAAWIYLSRADIERATEVLSSLEGVEEVLEREHAAHELRLPEDRIGDLVVLADASTAVGKTAAAHDLGALHGPLRSHGGRHEQTVPIVISHPLSEDARVQLATGVSNADAHDLLLNGLQ